MAYPTQDENFLPDMLRRKEIYSLRGDPDRNFRDPMCGNDKCVDEFANKYLKIQSHQLLVRDFMNPHTKNKRMHLSHMTGTGKCLGLNTPVMMRNGRVKMVQDITTDDILMGDDSGPRRVLSVCTGRATMVKISLYRGGVSAGTFSSSFTCNLDHILTLMRVNDDKIVDISVKHFMRLPPAEQMKFSAIKTSIELPHNVLPIGSMSPKDFGKCLDACVDYVGIPSIYKYTDRKSRMELLDGILADRGDPRLTCVYIHTSHELMNDVLWLCTSVGVDAQYSSHVGGLIIRGRNSPPRVLTYSFTIDLLHKDYYYGFSIAGNRRFLLGDCTVTHNTLAAISDADAFQTAYRKLYNLEALKMPPGRRSYSDLDRLTPTVFVLGFGGTKSAFTRDLLKYPEFGFISIIEREELIKRSRLASAGLPDDIKHYKEYRTHLKKRITSKSRGGFYKFYGYDEFVNRLFGADAKLIDLEVEVKHRRRAGEDVNLEDVMLEHINTGRITVNVNFLESFRDSLIICDEIHNTYNMNMKNNRGVAIQYVLDLIDPYFLSMSATPVNSPTEIIDVVNFLVPPEQKITKGDFFANSRTLRPGKLEELVKLVSGKMSFLQDANIKYYPERKFAGEEVIIPVAVDEFPAGSTIPYLKFVECPMSELHQKTYEDYLKKHADTHKNNKRVVDADITVDTTTDTTTDTTDTADTTTDTTYNHDEVDEVDNITRGNLALYPYHSIPTDGYSIFDMVFPSPDSVGIFRSNDVRKLAAAPAEWKESTGINFKKFSNNNNVIVGEFLQRKNIGKYSTKYAKLLDILTKIIAQKNPDPNNCQKIMIYHNSVKMSGVLLVQELLKENGFLDETSEPVDNTICAVCGKTNISHGTAATNGSSNGTHDFRPARFIMAHGDLTKDALDNSIAKFDSLDNIHGLNYMIMVGSRKIKESYDFKGIQRLIVLSMPTSIPTLIQIFGRANRKYSHNDLPPEQRVVTIYILLTTSGKNASDPISPEMYRCLDKLADYKSIQIIERECNRRAIDGSIHRDIIMPDSFKERYFPHGETAPVDMLGHLYFEPEYVVPNYRLSDLTLSTFRAYGGANEEVNLITYLIKRLFMQIPVWKYDDLWKAVRAPPFGIEFNPALFLEDNFIIALSNLTTKAQTILSGNAGRTTEAAFIEKLFNPADRYIYIGSIRHKIEQVGEYYAIFPIVDNPANPLNVVHAEFTEGARDRERAMIKDLVEPNDQPIIDAETYSRTIGRTSGLTINIESFIKESKSDMNYGVKRDLFIRSYATRTDISGFLSEFSERFQMNIIEEAIAGSNTSESAQIVYSRVLELLTRFRVLITAGEVSRYKEILKYFKNPLGDPDSIIGYMSSKSIRLYDGVWFEVSKSSMNRHVLFRENDIIIGILESADDHTKFKLRRPVQHIRENVARELRERAITKMSSGTNAVRTRVSDTRLIERGIVCSTKSKRELGLILVSLGGKTDGNKIRNMCEEIKKRLFDLEAKERQKIKESKIKYMYFWWDDSPSITAI